MSFPFLGDNWNNDSLLDYLHPILTPSCVPISISVQTEKENRDYAIIKYQ